MVKSIEKPAGISYMAIQSNPRQTRKERDWKSLYHAQAAEAKIMRAVFGVMAILVAFSEITTVIAIRL